MMQTQEFAKLPQESSYCLYCPHCIQQRGDIEKMRKLLRKSLNFDESWILDNKESICEKITGNRLQGYFGSQIMSRRDQILLENLIFYLIEEKINPEEIVTEELYDRLKTSWLYQGFIWTKDT
mmetsp:Transcript_31346/g.30707  ORF Transcript_31346/g.30707 Transcript_31346/m.30707 type:complete len:123 (+) Transcript_31346:639-1007(+)